MIVDEAARRYARALYEAAGGPEAARRCLGQLEEIAQALSESAELRRVVEHPLIAPQVKERVLLRLFGPDLEEAVRRLLAVAFTRGRAGQVAAVADALRAEVDRAEGRRRAVVRSVAPLTDDQVAAVREALERRLGGSVEVSVEVDPALLGGLEIRVGDRVLDLSVARRLRDMRRRLAGTAVGGAADGGGS
ncbi:MAG: ATP synthase F1 subunit delta [Firmicutes bacterium]|nr:ATP synthase F1 subunit delta [Bacillota bacterium]